MAIENLNSAKNMEEVVETKDVQATTALTPATTAATTDSLNNAEHVESVFTDLDKAAKEVVTPNPEAPVVKAKNIYTKYTLDESVEDFKINAKELSDDSDEDEYLDYDMFDFVYGIVTDDWPRPKNPLGRPIRKFQHTESDDYLKTNSPTGMSQVATDVNGNVVVSANEVNAFDDVKAVCDYYHIRYGEVSPRKSRDSHWAFNFTIYVPQTSDGYPVMVEDFFSHYGLTMEDVIADHKVGKGKVANWGKTYDSKVTKDRNKDLNEFEVQRVFDEYVRKAANSNDPLSDFIRDMFATMDDRGLTYSANKLRKQFMNEFEDDFGDDE